MSETPNETPAEQTTDAAPTQTTDAAPQTTEAAAPTVWRPYGYADPATGTAEAPGADARPGRGEPLEPLVPDTAETREAEQHPGAVLPAETVAGATEAGELLPGAPDTAGDTAGAGADSLTGEAGAGAESAPYPIAATGAGLPEPNEVRADLEDAQHTETPEQAPGA